MKYLLFYFILLTSHLCFAQNEWTENREAYPNDDLGTEADFALSYLHYGIQYDYKYDEEGQFICDVTYHSITRPNNEDGLESVNRIYIPLRNVIEVLEVKARTISKNGNVVNLDQSNIKEIEDEENDGGYRIFAVEGAEVGGEIEYLYTKRVYGSTFISEPMQFTFPARNISFKLSAPENLEFEFFLANDERQISQTDTTEEYNQYEIEIDDIPAYSSEPFSGFDANKKRLEFRLAYNSVYGKKRINTYADAGKKIYDNSKSLSKEEQKSINDFIKEHDMAQGSTIERLRNLEHELKVRYYMDEDTPDDVNYLFQNGFAGKVAFLKIFVAIAEHIGVDFEIVATTNRFDTKFDPDFSTWNYLDDYLMHFPKERTFLSVHDYSVRYGSVSPGNYASLGLFIHPEMITDFVFPISRIGYIPATSYEKNMNNLDIDVSLDADLTTALVNAKRTYLGNEANYYKTVEYWMDKEQIDDLLDELAEYLATDGEVKNVKIEESNNTAEKWQNEPFVVTCNFENKNFVEFAGNSILFKVGNLIGLQSELYKSEERKFELENLNNRGYRREITFDIPKGYEIQNPNDIILNEEVYDDDNKPVYLFDSSFTIDGGQLKIKIDEFYNDIFFPKSRFEEFRKVINAAADWNKVTLVLKEI
ncbi:MAG: hypothetical protein ACI9QN_001109 [Arcticibacterium sp.]|jgi:hypothetical protein